MTPPGETDDESTRSAYWQGVVTTKLDNLTTAVETLVSEKTKIHENHEMRLRSLETSRTSQKAFLVGAMFGAGALGGSLGTVLGQTLF